MTGSPTATWRLTRSGRDFAFPDFRCIPAFSGAVSKPVWSGRHSWGCPDLFQELSLIIRRFASKNCVKKLIEFDRKCRLESSPLTMALCMEAFNHVPNLGNNVAHRIFFPLSLAPLSVHHPSKCDSLVPSNQLGRIVGHMPHQEHLPYTGAHDMLLRHFLGCAVTPPLRAALEGDVGFYLLP